MCSFCVPIVLSGKLQHNSEELKIIKTSLQLSPNMLVELLCLHSPSTTASWQAGVSCRVKTATRDAHQATVGGRRESLIQHLRFPSEHHNWPALCGFPYIYTSTSVTQVEENNKSARGNSPDGLHTAQIHDIGILWKQNILYELRAHFIVFTPGSRTPQQSKQQPVQGPNVNPYECKGCRHVHSGGSDRAEWTSV